MSYVSPSKAKSQQEAAKRRKVVVIVCIVLALLISVGFVSCAIVGAGAKGTADAILKHSQEPQSLLPVVRHLAAAGFL